MIDAGVKINAVVPCDMVPGWSSSIPWWHPFNKHHIAAANTMWQVELDQWHNFSYITALSSFVRHDSIIQHGLHFQKRSLTERGPISGDSLTAVPGSHRSHSAVQLERGLVSIRNQITSHQTVCLFWFLLSPRRKTTHLPRSLCCHLTTPFDFCN